MLPALQFLFSDFWHWLGAFLMLWTLTGGMARLCGFLWALVARRRERCEYD